MDRPKLDRWAFQSPRSERYADFFQDLPFVRQKCDKWFGLVSSFVQHLESTGCGKKFDGLDKELFTALRTRLGPKCTK